MISKLIAAILHDPRPRGIKLTMRLLCLERAPELAQWRSRNEFLHLQLTPIRASADDEGQDDCLDRTGVEVLKFNS